MRFSIFDNDGALGDLAGTRVVVLKGTVTVSQLFSPNLFNVDQWMRTGLENQGFSVNAVRMSAAGWVGYTNNIEIELNVFHEFSAAQVRSNAIRAIENVTANYGLNRVFSNVALNVIFDANSVAGAGTSGGVPSGYDRSNDPPLTSGDFFKNLGTSLGISTPIALVVGGIVVLWMVRR